MLGTSLTFYVFIALFYNSAGVDNKMAQGWQVLGQPKSGGTGRGEVGQSNN